MRPRSRIWPDGSGVITGTIWICIRRLLGARRALDPVGSRVARPSLLGLHPTSSSSTLSPHTSFWPRGWGCGERDGEDEVLCSVIGNQSTTPLANRESAGRSTPRALPAAIPRVALGPFPARGVLQPPPPWAHDGCVRLAVHCSLRLQLCKITGIRLWG